MQINLNQYIKIVFISEERIKKKFIRLFAVSSIIKNIIQTKLVLLSVVLRFACLAFEENLKKIL